MEATAVKLEWVVSCERKIRETSDMARLTKRQKVQPVDI